MRCELVRGVLDVLRGPDAETSLRIDRRLPDGSSWLATHLRSSSSGCADGAYGMNAERVSINRLATRCASAVVAGRNVAFTEA